MMQKIIQYRFSSTIALISGAPKYDSQLHNIAKTLEKVSNKQVSFVGVVGSQYQSILSKVYASSNVLDNHQFQVTRAYNTYHEDIQDCPIMPYRAYTHFKNYQLIKTLEKSNFFSDALSNKISAVATVGNFSLAARIGQKLNQYALKSNRAKPYSVLFHRQNTERTVQNQEILDFQYYNVEKALTNAAKYRFPSLCVGYDGLYRAFQYLQQFKAQSTEDVFWTQNFSYDVSQLVKKARSSYRKSKGISEDKYIFYIDAGSNSAEIKFSFKSFKDGFKKFFNHSNIRSISSDHFEIFISSPNNQNVKSQIQGKLGYLPNNIKVTLIEEKDKYAALSSSDFGLLHNGQITVEAAAVQLPSLVVDSMSNIHAYFNNLYNGHASPLNIATNYQAYEDLCGSSTANGQRVGNSLLKHFENPKMRYYYAKLYRDQIQQILSKSGLNPHLRVSQTGLQTGCRHLFQKAELFNKLEDSSALRKKSQRRQTFS